MVNWWFGALWFGVRIGVHPRIQTTNAPNHQAKPLAEDLTVEKKHNPQKIGSGKSRILRTYLDDLEGRF